MLSFIIKKYKKHNKEEKDKIKKNKLLNELVTKYNIKTNKKIKLKSTLSFIIDFSKFYFMLITILFSLFLLTLNIYNKSNSKLDYFKENQSLNQESFKNEILKSVVKNENLKSFEEYKKFNYINFEFFDNYKNEINFDNYKNEIDVYYSNKGNIETIVLVKKSGEILYLNHINKENNNFKVTTNKNENFINYNYSVHSTKYFKFDYMNKDSNIIDHFYKKIDFIPIENTNFFNTIFAKHFKYKVEIETLFKDKNEVNYTYANTYPLNINYTEKEIEAYENDLKFFEIMTLIYFLSLIITLISLYIPKKYYDTKLIKKERDEFILNEANKKSNYKIEYDNKSFNDYDINKIKKHKNVISI